MLKISKPIEYDRPALSVTKEPREVNLLESISRKPAACKCCGSNELKEVCEKEGYSFWECIDCAFIFTNLRHEELLEIYEKGYHGIENGAPKKGWLKSLEFLSPALSWLPDKELKIMDFGCGECKLPDRLRREGHRVIAVDIMPPLKHHPDRLTGDIMDLDIPANSFDLIYSYQVFEHIAEPRHVLKRLCRLLKEGGMILIHTDMETSERHSGEFENWWYVLPPDHCSYYRHTTFEKMFDEFGCRVIYKNSKVILATK